MSRDDTPRCGECSGPADIQPSLYGKRLGYVCAERLLAWLEEVLGRRVSRTETPPSVVDGEET